MGRLADEGLPRDGQEVVDLLNQRGALVDDIGTFDDDSLPVSTGDGMMEEVGEREMKWHRPIRTASHHVHPVEEYMRALEQRAARGSRDAVHLQKEETRRREKAQRSNANVSVSEMLYGADGTLAAPVAWRGREDGDTPITRRSS